MQLKQPKVQLPGQQPNQPGKSGSQQMGGAPVVPPAPAGNMFQPLAAPSPRQMTTPAKQAEYAGGGQQDQIQQIIKLLMSGGGF